MTSPRESAGAADRLVSRARDESRPAQDLCSDLVRIPSPSGHEEAVAQRVALELKGAGLDEVTIDAAGNVIGILRALSPRDDGALLLDGHLDCVDEGDPADWPHPPFEAVVSEGRLWGRGATDTKGTVAAQVRALALLAREQAAGRLELTRDVVFAGVVQEEVGGLGTAFLLEDPPARFVAAIVGEPSDGQLSIGHRGRVEVAVTFRGRAAHASRPDWGNNPHPSLARFITRLEGLERGEDARFGRSTVVPTLVEAQPKSPNVSPQSVTLTLDWRNVPGEDAESVRRRVEALAEEVRGEGIEAIVAIPTRRLVSWRGVTRDVERISRPFATDPDSPLFEAARHAVARAVDRPVEAVTWDFASDGGWLHAAGIPCIGHGPGEPRVMHAVNESVRLDRLAESVLVNAALLLALMEAAP